MSEFFIPGQGDTGDPEIMRSAWQRIITAADMATDGKVENLRRIERMLKDPNDVVRYWGAVGCIVLAEKANELRPALSELRQDPTASVRIAAAEAALTASRNLLEDDPNAPVLGNPEGD